MITFKTEAEANKFFETHCRGCFTEVTNGNKGEHVFYTVCKDCEDEMH